MPSIADLLKYAQLQMAAEALFGYDANINPNQKPGQPFVGAIPENFLTDGNRHASKFTLSEAKKFAAQWKVVEHLSNTTTGFSGTLFFDSAATEYVLSFRSTEFLDDAARDNQATNAMEIKPYGWAFGQIADMEDWYVSLKGRHLIPAGVRLNITGYSLGGHLATAFNLLHPTEVAAAYTFNGAGVGRVNSGIANLGAVIDAFNLQRKNADGQQIVFSDPAAKAVYADLRSRFSNGAAPTNADIINLSIRIEAGEITRSQGELLLNSLRRIKDITDEIARLQKISSGRSVPGEPSTPAAIPGTNVEAAHLDYQLAVLIASKSTQGASIPGEILNTAIGGRNTAGYVLPGAYDVYGATYPSAVASSQIHYGAPTPVFVEDQPLWRGSVIFEAIKASFEAFDVKLLVNGYAGNDFGDTHSLVLMVDALAVQSVLVTVDPSISTATLTSIFKAASAAKAESASGTQGKAEGDVLENVVNGLSQILLGNARPALGTKLDGNTWADFTDRTDFYNRLDAMFSAIRDKGLSGKVTLALPDGTVAAAARTDFAAFLTLFTGSPVALKTVSGQESVVAAALGAAWADVDGVNVYANWQSDKNLTPAERASGKANYTDSYLTDRSKFLDWTKEWNLANGRPEAAKHVAEPWRFTDMARKKTYEVTPNGASYTRFNQVIFGKDQTDSDTETLTGDILTDRIYGGGGNDTIDGKSGSDYLEGNAGSDIITGGTGNDVLLGGADGDILEGGKDNDLLIGGSGDDTYVFTSGDGWDWIEDQDGVGTITYDRVALGRSPIVKRADNVWQEVVGDKVFTYSLCSQSDSTGSYAYLAIQGASGGMWVKRWQDGQLGISLPDLVPVTPAAVNATISGPWYDQYRNSLVGTGLRPADAAAIGGRDPMGGTTGTAAENYLRGGAGNDRLTGNGGRDALVGQGGNDTLDGGLDDDALSGGDGADDLFGSGNYEAICLGGFNLYGSHAEIARNSSFWREAA